MSNQLLADKARERELDLISAAKNGDYALLEDLLDDSLWMPPPNPNAQANNGWTPGHFAARHGFSDCLRLLLDAGLDPSIRSDDGLTPEEVAREFGQASCEALLRAARIRDKASEGLTA